MKRYLPSIIIFGYVLACALVVNRLFDQSSVEYWLSYALSMAAGVAVIQYSHIRWYRQLLAGYRNRVKYLEAARLSKPTLYDQDTES